MSKHARRPSATKTNVARWQVGVVVAVLLLVAAVLALKQAGPSATAPVDRQGVNTQDLVSEVDPGSFTNPLAPEPGEDPETHVERLLDAGYPIFVFFHSTTCYQCIEMTKIVDEVYPDFELQVALVDVNVYDEGNQPLLQRAGIRVIPTLVFFDRTGNGQGFTGVMPAESLRSTLTTLSDGDQP